MSYFSRAPNQTHPWLLVSHGDNFENHGLFDISKDQYFLTCIPELRGKQVALASYGWLALLDVGNEEEDCTCCLYNITSNDKIPIPHTNYKMYNRYYECVLSKPPTDPDCYVMLFSVGFDDILNICRIGDENFYDCTKEYGDDYISTAASFGGKTYAWMSKSNSLFGVEFCEEWGIRLGQLLCVKEPICTWPLKPSATKEFLVEFCGKILLVHAILDMQSDEVGDVVYFRIFSLGMGGDCSELLNIGDRAIFIGPYGNVSVLCSDKSGVKKNSIYYYWHSENLHVYDIEDRTTTLFQPCPIKDTEYLMCWI